VALKAVFFDVGETLVDETRHWTAVAEEVGVPAFTFFALAGALIERGVRDHAAIFEELGVARVAGPPLGAGDLYPDALPCLEGLRSAGYLVGAVGNTTVETEDALRDVVDVVGSSERWGLKKPAAAFFDRIVAEAGVPADEIASVGDRVDNDVEPALGAGMVAVHVRRGPWGWIQKPPPEAICIGSLAELSEAL
jgi:FMN phosphatase YigB (HAD superfamily)